MSSRYGRNKRRAHREEIARLTEAYEMAAALAARGYERLRQLQTQVTEWDGEIARILGERSAFRSSLPAVKAYGRPLRVAALRERISMARITEAPMLESLEIATEKLRTFVLHCDQDYEQLRRHIRFREVTEDGAERLVLSATLADEGFGDVEECWMYQRIAEQMRRLGDDKLRGRAA